MPTTLRIDLSFLDKKPKLRKATPPVAVPVPEKAKAREWDPAAAVALEEAADALVERLGVSGCHPGIQLAAARCVEAHRRRDLGAVRSACKRMADQAVEHWQKVARRSDPHEACKAEILLSM